MKIRDLRTLNEANATKEAQGYIRNRFIKKGLSRAEADAMVAEFNLIINDSKKQLQPQQQMNMAKEFINKYENNQGQDKNSTDTDDLTVGNYSPDSEGKYSYSGNSKKEIEEQRLAYNKAKTTEEKDECVAKALELAGVNNNITKALNNKNLRGLLTEFIEALDWTELRKDNKFLSFLNRLNDKSLLLKSWDYFELAYNEYVSGNEDIRDTKNTNVINDQYWKDKMQNKKDDTESIELTKDIKQLAKNLKNKYSEDEIDDLVSELQK